MTSTELLVAIGGAALGYWFIAVAWPLLRGRGDNAANAPGDAPFQADPPWHEVLGVSADAERAIIDAAHRAKREEYLPERVARLGAGARRQAQWRLMEIDRAYAAAMRELGFGRDEPR